MKNSGSLTVVGTGIKVGADITTRAYKVIQQADIVYFIVPNKLSRQWLSTINSNIVDLSLLYQDGKSRIITYNEMINCIVNAVKSGQQVCTALYGHPGVFAYVGHKAIKMLRQDNYSARMEPGISAEDCLFADLGIDPAKSGCVSIEATQFLFYNRNIDPCSLYILWQIGLLGDHTLALGQTNSYHAALEVLTKRLLDHYPPNHKVIIYEASSIEIFPPRIEEIELIALGNAKLTALSTLVILPAQEAILDNETLGLLGITESDIKAVLSNKI
ncbi:SAM-dependent methyltransferase [Psychrobium sp. MM17-31]|uniref:SAM-dependent methyltransferase n=1 Tax=Psychrobium sp. MM17-31 TaxID=2917758 RepID=UPI001EF4E41B|nr:SAM-dependent methyltransferase [Psychrobium sp. MM17-31]MCG7532800.1 SAM-dependent methyltransferase [Psychrobium sp. MM17-31]